MAAPAPVARVKPPFSATDKPVTVGQGVLVTFTANPDVSFEEREVTPPGIDGGDPIDVVTHFNLKWRVKAPRLLKEMQDVTFTAFYHPAVWADALALCNVPTTITVKYTNGDTLAFYGYLRSVAHAAHNEGNTAPLATVTIVVTNMDPATGTEEDPVFTPFAGAAPMMTGRVRSRPRSRQRQAA